MSSWEAPDPSRPAPRLDQWVSLEVAEHRGSWARIVCSNGWSAWVDARRLLELDTGDGPTTAPASSPASASPSASASPGAPAGATASASGADRPASAGFALPQGRSMLALAGAALVAVASFLPWLDVGGLSVSAMDIAASILWSINPGDFFLKVGVVLLLLGGGAAATTMVPTLARYRKPAGIAIAVITAGFVVQLGRSLKGSGTGVMDAIGIGVYAALAAGVMIFAGEGATAAAATPGTAPGASPAEPPPTIPGWTATHRAPPAGMRAWDRPDPSAPVATRLRPGMPLRVVDTRGAWAHVEASNGWRAWVDARRLEGSQS